MKWCKLHQCQCLFLVNVFGYYTMLCKSWMAKVGIYLKLMKELGSFY
jgi:hypothetical protein